MPSAFDKSTNHIFRRCFATNPPHPSESFLSGTNNIYVEEMYRAWSTDPSSVHKSWDVYFSQVEKGAQPGAAFIPPPTIQKGITPTAGTSQASSSGINDALALSNLIRAYQVHGHRAANLDPLGLAPRLPPPDYKQFGFTPADMDRQIQIPQNL